MNEEQFLENKIILITNAFLMIRAKALFERFGLEVLEFPVDFKGKCSQKNKVNLICLLPNSSSLHYSSFALREIIGRIFYRVGL